MSRTFIMELMNKEIDGQNSQHESNELKRFLNEDAEAQSIFNELSEVSEILSDVHQVEPPPHLKVHILNSIRVRKMSPIPQKKVSVVALSQNFFKRNYRYAFALSMGVILTVFLFFVFSEELRRYPTVDDIVAQGTLIFKGIPSDLHIVDQADIALPGASGSIIVKQAAGILVSQFDLKSESEVSVRFEFDENDVTIQGWGQMNNNVAQVRSNSNSIEILNKGENAYVIVFNDRSENSQPLQLTIESEGHTIFRKELNTAQK